ncbi:MAG: hypothetical protein JWL73_1001 [Actinomycetia bacterium]|nr:hypothetical protein [Actinomycetes bacterium]
MNAAKGTARFGSLTAPARDGSTASGGETPRTA